MKPDRFLASHSVFTRGEFEAALGGRAAATIDSHLSRWRRQGRIERVKQGVFARLDPAAPDATPLPDLVALASRMAPDAAVAFHTALEVHGCAQSVLERLTFISWTGAKGTSFRGRQFVAVRPHAALLAADGGARWVERTERRGIEVRVTTIERTVVDVLDRPRVAGGIEEVWRSLLSVPALDLESLVDYVDLLGGRTLAAKVGFFLDQRREDLLVSERTLERLRRRIPTSPVYLDRRLRGSVVSRWALIVPHELARTMEDVTT